MRPTWLLGVGLLGLLWSGSLWAWPRLPERIPVHFGASGLPDDWARTSFLSWFALPLIALAILLLNAALARWLPRHPRLINLPDKERFLALPPAFRQPVVERLQRFLDCTTAQVVVLFGWIQYVMYRTAQGADSRPYMLGVLLFGIVLLPLLSLRGIARVQKEINRQVQRHERSPAT